ncbi:MAG: hypothetical protein NC453_29890 [Muribaculum sp.]|nr:hypothetical protein [Muribaculum sp.]
MKKYYPLLILLLLVIQSCGNNKTNITWKTYTCQDKAYTVEIPSDFSLHSTEVGGWMAFEKSSNNSSDAAFITIQPVTDGFTKFNEELNGNPKFQYSVYKEAGNLKFAECSKGMWSAVQLGMLKEIDGVEYLIELSSQGSRSNAEEIIQHIYDSMVGGTSMTSVSQEDDKTDSEFKTYSNPYLSIIYPKEWSIVKNPDGMTDVYIGAQDETLGYTIVRFNTEASLNEIVQEAKEGARAGGMRISENNNTTINGLPCNRMVNEFDYNGIAIKTIAYNFKKGDTFYSIKFGTQKKYVDANGDLIKQIINSLELK